MQQRYVKISVFICGCAQSTFSDSALSKSWTHRKRYRFPFARILGNKDGTDECPTWSRDFRYLHQTIRREWLCLARRSAHRFLFLRPASFLLPFFSSFSFFQSPRNLFARVAATECPKCCSLSSQADRAAVIVLHYVKISFNLKRLSKLQKP